MPTIWPELRRPRRMDGRGGRTDRQIDSRLLQQPLINIRKARQEPSTYIHEGIIEDRISERVQSAKEAGVGAVLAKLNTTSRCRKALQRAETQKVYLSFHAPILREGKKGAFNGTWR